MIGRHYTANESFNEVFLPIAEDLLAQDVVDTGHWQAMKGVRQTQTLELQHVIIKVPISPTSGSWASFMEPNVEWADEHFAERVGGEPVNPPPSHVKWPYAQAGNEEHTDNRGAFSHSYPERMWPRYAGRTRGSSGEYLGENRGIRYFYGDLSNAVDLLLQEPHTRQCYIPMWFPEDLHAAAVEKVRVPCSLGWHLMLREDKLHCFYPMRSLDLLRYARDDAYMAGRLVQWVIGQCRNREDTFWKFVRPGQLTMFASSLHIFADDVPILKHKYGIEATA